MIHDRFINKKATQFFKKYGRPPTSTEKLKWTGEYKKYQKRQASKTRTNTERLFGKMTNQQWKEHQRKRNQFRQEEEKRRKRGY